MFTTILQCWLWLSIIAATYGFITGGDLWWVKGLAYFVVWPQALVSSVLRLFVKGR